MLGKIRHQQEAEGLNLMCTSLLLNFPNDKENVLFMDMSSQIGHELFEGRRLIHLCTINTERSASYTVFVCSVFPIC